MEWPFKIPITVFMFMINFHLSILAIRVWLCYDFLFLISQLVGKSQFEEKKLSI